MFLFFSMSLYFEDIFRGIGECSKSDLSSDLLGIFQKRQVDSEDLWRRGRSVSHQVTKGVWWMKVTLRAMVIIGFVSLSLGQVKFIDSNVHRRILPVDSQSSQLPKVMGAAWPVRILPQTQITTKEHPKPHLLWWPRGPVILWFLRSMCELRWSA